MQRKKKEAVSRAKHARKQSAAAVAHVRTIAAAPEPPPPTLLPLTPLHPRPPAHAV
jgi:hypothetical protein